MPKASPFRQAALDRLSSPEQLDQLLEISQPKAWVALAGLWLLIAVALGWSVFGRLPVTISGSGILLSSAGVREVEALGSGVVQTLTVREGQLVEVGTRIATISQPRLAQQVTQATERVRLLREELHERQTFVAKNSGLETASLDAEHKDIERRLSAMKERLTYLEGRVTAEREARGLGLVTEASVQSSVQALETGRGESAALELELQNNKLRRLLLSNRGIETVGQVEDRIRDAERELASHTMELEQATNVTSPYRGFVREIRTNIGQLTTAGQALVSIEMAGVPLQALIFVPSEGKRIERGMDARITPVTVRQEEFGYMIGSVQSVSTQPVTMAGIARTLGNDILVQQIAARGASFLVEISLVADSSTASGLKWSSRQGPPMKIGSGTTVEVSVVVSRRRPISLLLPFVRSAFGMAA